MYQSIKGPKWRRHVFNMTSNRVSSEIYRAAKSETQKDQAMQAAEARIAAFDACETYAQQNRHFMLVYAMLTPQQQIETTQRVLLKALDWENRAPGTPL